MGGNAARVEKLILESQKPSVQDISAAFHNNETEISVREWVLTQEPDTYGDQISQLLQINQCAGRLERKLMKKSQE